MTTFTVSAGQVVSNIYLVSSYMDVLSGGLAYTTSVDREGVLTVSSGGSTSGTLVYIGGTENVVGSGAVATASELFASATQAVAYGGILLATTVHQGAVVYVTSGYAYGLQLLGGGMNVFEGGFASGTSVNSGANLLVSAYGIGSATTVNSGSVEVVLSSGIARATQVNSGGWEIVSAGGVASATTVLVGGSQTVVGGTTSLTQLQGGVQHVSAGGYASATSIGSGGRQYVSSGGTTSFTQVLSGGRETVYSGGLAAGTTVLSGGTLYETSGATGGDNVVSNGGVESVLGGGVATRTTVRSGGMQLLSLGAALTRSTTVSNGGLQKITSLGLASGTIVSSGGSQIVSGTAIDTLISAGGSAEIYAGGVASNTAIQGSGAVQTVFGGGLASGTQVSDDGLETIYSGGIASGTLASSYGTQHVIDGGIAYGTTLSQGYQHIDAGGLASGTILNDQGAVSAGSGGVVSSATVNSGGYDYLDVGARAEGTTINSGGGEYVDGETNNALVNPGGEQWVYAGGAASNTTLSGGFQYVSGSASFAHLYAGTQQVFSGGMAFATTLRVSGRQMVSAGGEAMSAFVYSGGEATILGRATSAYLSGGGIQAVGSGGLANGTQVGDLGLETVSSGGVANNTVVSSGGVQTVLAFGTANATLLLGGTQSVGSGGLASATVVSSGGNQQISSGGVASATVVSSGGYDVVLSGGRASATQVSGGGFESVEAGGSATGTTLSGATQYVAGTAVATSAFGGGVQQISSGGLASATVVNSGGSQQIGSGGLASATVVSTGGNDVVQSGGSATGTILDGGYEFVAGTAVATSAFSGGFQVISSGALASASLIGSGGYATVLSGGRTSLTHVALGGLETVESGGSATGTSLNGGNQIVAGTAVATSALSGSIQQIDPGGLASATTISGGVQRVRSGALASASLVGSGGSQRVSSGGVANGTTISNGGNQYVSSGGVASGTTIEAGGVQVLYDGAAAADTVLQAGGTIDVATLSFASGGTASLNAATDTLTVLAGGVTFTQVLVGDYSGLSFVLAADGSGGTSISAAAVSSFAIAADAASQPEGNAGVTPFTFTVSRTGDTSATDVLAWAVAGVAPDSVDGSDFVGGGLPFGLLSFAPGELGKTITVNVQGDTAVEPDEQFLVGIATFSGSGIIASASATVTIADDDSASGPPSFAVVASDASKAEGDAGSTPFTFIVIRSGSTAGVDSVVWSATGLSPNPVNPTDFAGGVVPQGTLTFAAGVVTQTITVGIAGDTLAEADEHFRVVLSGASSGSTITTASASASVLNDDTNLAVASTTGSKPEGNGGATPFLFTVTRTGVLTGSSTATWSILGAAPASVGRYDFVGAVVPSGTVSFAPGETSQVITVEVQGDTLLEPDEWFTVGLHAPSGATITGNPALAKIVNDEAAFDISAADASKAEGHSGSTPFTFTVSRTGNIAGTHTIAWGITGNGANPTNAADFAGGSVPTGVLTFAPSVTTQTITVNVHGDVSVEADEGFSVVLSNASAAATILTHSAAATILNDDTGFSIASTTGSRPEGDSGSTPFLFTVTRSGVVSGSNDVAWNIIGAAPASVGGLDFAGGVAPPGTLSFAPGETTQVITVDIAGDTLLEPDEWFRVNLRQATGGASIIVPSALAKIVNDDTAFSISADTPALAEGNSGATDFTFTVTRTGNIAGTHSIGWLVSGQQPNSIGPADFVGGTSPNGSLLFTPGEVSKTITVAIQGDSYVEPDEHFVVLLRHASAGAAITVNNAPVTILDDDGGAPDIGVALTQVASTDFNADGVADLLRLAGNGDLFLLDGSSGTQQAVSQSAYGLKFVGAADLNGDGRADILLQSDNGGLYDWTMDGATVQRADLITTLAAGTTVAQVEGADILLHAATPGAAPWMLLHMHGGTIAATAAYDTRPTL